MGGKYESEGGDGARVVAARGGDDRLSRREGAAWGAGIVRDISQVLAANGVNIEELTTGVVSGSFSGETLFRVMASLRAPNIASMDAVRAGLEQLGNEMMVDIHPSPE